jgi:RNA polymerase sigma-70 factor (ECF subfamily)
MTWVGQNQLWSVFPLKSNNLAIAEDRSRLRERVSVRDEDLMKAFQKGEVQAFETLLARHRRPLFNFLFKFLGNAESAEEAFQEVFLRIVRSSADYQPSAKFTTWMYTVARHYCIDHARKEKFRHHVSLENKVSGGDEAETLASRFATSEPGADKTSSAKELEAHLLRILDELNPEQKEVFLLREFQGLQFDEIATVTNVSTNTVKSRMRYALQAIQKKFQDLGIGGDL